MTPGCTVCGYVVEVVRSCFSSRWRLFQGRSETTAGQYIFADEETPCYPGWHNLWSRDWISDELQGAQLGEDPDAQRKYTLGASLGWVPAPQLIGSADCIANGERWPLAVVPTLEGGFDARCSELVAAPRFAIDVSNREDWCFWAEVVELTYTDATAARAMVATALGVAPAGVVQQFVVGATPAWFALVPPAPDPVVLVISGTTTPGQWLTQIAFGIGPPIGFGAFATHPIWFGISSIVLGRLLATTIGPTQPIILVGHSLGASVASILAARLRQANDQRRIQLLTLGSPRVGDARLYAILRTTQMVNLQNDRDVVTLIPANQGELPPDLAVLFSAAYPVGCLLWSWQPNRFRITWEGQILEGAAIPGVAEVATQIIRWHYLGDPFPYFADHVQQEYERRLCRPAPLALVWLDAWILAQLSGDPVAVWPNIVNALLSALSIDAGSTPTYAIDVQNLLRAIQFDGAQVLQLADLVGTTASWSYYSVLEIVWPAVDFDLLARIGVPVSAFGSGGFVDGEWQGSLTSLPGWTVTIGTIEVTLPWIAGDNVPTLIAVYWDNGELKIYLESLAGNTATGSGSVIDTSFKSIGGFSDGAQPTLTASLLLGEFIYYEDTLPADKDESVLDYLRQKWLSSTQGIITEGGDPIITENGYDLITEAQSS